MAALLAFVVAALATGAALVVSTYPRTFPLLLRSSWAFWLYCVVYGSAAAALVLTELAGVVGVPGVTITSAWTKAFLFGLGVPALRSFLSQLGLTVSWGRRSLPLRLGALLGGVDRWFLQQVALDHHAAVRRHVAPRARMYPDLADVRRRIADSAPSSVPEVDIAAFLQDLNDDRVTASVTDAMERCLLRFGRATFEMAFPLPNGQRGSP